MRQSILASLFSVGLTAMLVGCSNGLTVTLPRSASSSVGSALSTAVSTAAATASAAPSSSAGPVWHRESDAATGISFELPGVVKTSTQPAVGPQGQKYEIRAYTAALSDRVGSSVAVETSLSGELYAVILSKAPQAFVSQFKSAGAADVTATDPVPVTVDGNPGVDFQLTFTGGGGGHVLWLFRMVQTAHAQVTLQTFCSDASTPPDEVKQLNARLTTSLQFP
jgi:hypothetical protein